MPKRREVPRAFEVVGGYGDFDDEGLAPTERTQFVFVGSDCGRADDEWQALMEAVPFTEPDVSRTDRLELRDVIADALDDLDEQEQWIFDGLFVRGMSLRELGREIAMPKSTVARWRDRLLLRLREKLQVDPKIIAYLDDH